MYGEVVIHFLLCIVFGSSQDAFTKNKINNGGAASDAVFGILNAGKGVGLPRGAQITTRSVDLDSMTTEVTGNSDKWLHDLRKSLMRDNYDYQSGSGSDSALVIASASGARAGSISYSSDDEDTDISSIIMRDKPPRRRDFDASVIISDQEPSVARQTVDDVDVKRFTPPDDSSNDVKRFTPPDDSSNDVKRFTPPDDSSNDVKRFTPPYDGLNDVKRLTPPDRNLDGVKRFTPPDRNFKKDLERFTPAPRQNFNGLNKITLTDDILDGVKRFTVTDRNFKKDLERFTPTDRQKLKGVKRFTVSPRFRGVSARSEVSFPPLTPRPPTKARSSESWAKERAIIDREFESRRRTLRDNLYYLEDQLQPEYYVSDDRPRDTKYKGYRSDSANPPQQNNELPKSQRKQWMSFNDYEKPQTALPPMVVDSSGIRRYRVDKKNRFRAFGDATEASRKRHAINSLLARNDDVQRMTGLRFPWNDGRRHGDLESFDHELRKIEPPQRDEILDLDGIPPEMGTNENLDRNNTDWQNTVKKVFGKMIWEKGNTGGDTGKKMSRMV